jgi:DNA invertase Pin-like site-specific DNA recombinase
LIAAAQYLRTSRRFEDAYLQRQRQAIAGFARQRDFTIVSTYADSARSGLVLNGRPGMQQLLRDVLQRKASFEAILVYDVSRWGRFQDPDEAAHYEFLCKRVGVPVYYCCESYVNEKTASGALFKNMRRTQAGEFSRELGEKVYRASRRVAEAGFRTGGLAGYGFRRMMISAEGQPLLRLEPGQWKYSQNNRVVLTLGPKQEIETVRQIFNAASSNGADCAAIARDLNRRRVDYSGGRPWDYYDVRRLLTNPKYAGQCVWGRTSARLKTPKRDVEIDRWVIKRDAFPEIVDTPLFERVQLLLRRRARHLWTDDELLLRLARLFKAKGRLSFELIERASQVPSPKVYVSHFGTLRKAYSLVGYSPEKDPFLKAVRKEQTEEIRNQLFGQLRVFYPRDIHIFCLPNRSRCILRLDNGLSVSVVLCRSLILKTGDVGWRIYPTHCEREYITLLCRLNRQNDGILDFRLFPFVEKRSPYLFKGSDAWFRRGRPLRNIKDLSIEAKLLSRIDDQSQGVHPTPLADIAKPGKSMVHMLGQKHLSAPGQSRFAAIKP